jgi:hypothetical protein
MSIESENNNRIAKNTLLLYVRMLLLMAVSLYTSRVILDALGVDDFGIYNVVGGLLAMLNIFSTAMHTTTRRYINVEMGKPDGNINKVLKVVQLGEAIPSGLPPIGYDDDGKRKFNMSYSLTNEKRKQFLAVDVEVLDDKALPFDCMFTIDTKNFMSYKPDESFCEECKRGQKGILKFGPYELPIPKIGSGKVLYAHIWPADKNIMPNVFRKNHIKIQL